jgi:hypothetical protein
MLQPSVHILQYFHYDRISIPNRIVHGTPIKKDLTFPISIPTHMIILGKHRTTGNLGIYPAEEAINKQGSKKDFCYTLITSSHRLGMYGLH